MVPETPPPTPPDAPSEPPAKPSRSGIDLGQWAGAGFEFGASVLLFFLLGSWADATWGTQPWMRVAGSLLGVVVGTYLLIRQALKPDWIDETKRVEAPPRDLKRP